MTTTAPLPTIDRRWLYAFMDLLSRSAARSARITVPTTAGPRTARVAALTPAVLSAV